MDDEIDDFDLEEYEEEPWNQDDALDLTLIEGEN